MKKMVLALVMGSVLVSSNVQANWFTENKVATAVMVALAGGWIFSEVRCSKYKAKAEAGEQFAQCFEKNSDGHMFFTNVDKQTEAEKAYAGIFKNGAFYEADRVVVAEFKGKKDATLFQLVSPEK
ncbi:MAG: hypothetical protein WC707_04255 [Candidatus Babeliaceae bacterium]|jgi:hypothetical protein